MDVTRRTARAVAAFGLSVLGAWGLGVVLTPASADAAEPVPAMTFKGAVNVLGQLDAITVRPASVSVPAGGAAMFVNGAGVPLTLTVGGRTAALPTGGTRTFTFAGKAVPQRITVRAAALDLPVIGTLISSTGIVTVGAADRREPPSPRPPAPGASLGPGHPGGPPVAGSRPNPRPPLPGSSLGAGPEQPSVDRAASRGPRSTDRPAKTSPEPVGAWPAIDSGSGIDSSRSPDVVTTVSSGIGLLILVATVLVGGVGSAVLRTVLAQRSVPSRKC